MKKWIIMICVLVVTLSIVGFDNKFWYPALPIDSVSKKEALESLNNSSEDIAKIAEENGYDWFITRMEQGKSYENVKKLISKRGWEFQKQEGSGYFFRKGNKTLIAGAQMWTKNYVIVQIPTEWNE